MDTQNQVTQKVDSDTDTEKLFKIISDVFDIAVDTLNQERDRSHTYVVRLMIQKKISEIQSAEKEVKNIKSILEDGENEACDSRYDELHDSGYYDEPHDEEIADQVDTDRDELPDTPYE